MRKMQFVSVMKKGMKPTSNRPSHTLPFLLKCGFQCRYSKPPCSSYIYTHNGTHFLCFYAQSPLDLLTLYTQFEGPTILYAGCDLDMVYTIHRDFKIRACLSKLQNPQVRWRSARNVLPKLNTYNITDS